jgi:hypothetical protein
MKIREIAFGGFLGCIGWAIIYFAALGVKFYWYTEVKGFILTMPPGGYGEVMHKVNAYTVVGEDLLETVECEFDEPLKHLTLINHWYDRNEEMYADYILLADPAIHEEIWGWSNCIWQPDDDWAACDVYLVKPDFVHADMNVDTIGHEVLHGACRDFHD